MYTQTIRRLNLNIFNVFNMCSILNKIILIQFMNKKILSFEK